MSQEFEIRCSTSDSRLVFTGEVPRGLSGYDGCTFEVTLEGRPVSASVAVNDIQPHGWSEFFASLARDFQDYCNDHADRTES